MHVLLACAAAAAALQPPATQGARTETASSPSNLSPALFAELATGIARVRTFTCAGSPEGEGTGFLVGSSVVMTAYHVVRGSCRVKVVIDGRSLAIANWSYWGRNAKDGNAADVATIKLKAPTDGHIFIVRTWSAAKGANLSALGHPLGNELSLSQGRVAAKARHSGVPMLAVRLLGGQGGSGSPLVDDSGNVVSILQVGLGSADILGQYTAGVVLGIDLPSWWNGRTRRALCKAYKNGGIPGCGGTGAAGSGEGETSPPPPTPGAPGTRSNPWPLGTSAGNSGWTLKVNSVSFDAWPVVSSYKPSNPRPPAGYVDVMVSITFTYSGSGTGSLAEIEQRMALRGASDYPWSPIYQSCGIAPPPNSLDSPRVPQGANVTVNECWMLQASDVPSLVLAAQGPSGSQFFALR